MGPVGLLIPYIGGRGPIAIDGIEGLPIPNIGGRGPIIPIVGIVGIEGLPMPYIGGRGPVMPIVGTDIIPPIGGMKPLVPMEGLLPPPGRKALWAVSENKTSERIAASAAAPTQVGRR